MCKFYVYVCICCKKESNLLTFDNKLLSLSCFLVPCISRFFPIFDFDHNLVYPSVSILECFSKMSDITYIIN